MKAQPKSTEGKQSANRRQNKAIAAQGRHMTGKLPGMVTPLPASHFARHRQQKLAEANMAETTVAIWNAFNTKFGSFADEYASL